MALVSLQSLSLSYGSTCIFDQISLQIEKGQKIGLLGRNGSGKSTLMRCIGGEVKPDSGQVQISHGVKTACFTQEIPENLDGNVFTIIAGGLGEEGELLARYHQAECLEDEKSAEELARLRQQIDRADAWKGLEEIGRVTSRLGLEPDAIYQQLSGGMKRRVLLARALASCPDVLLLDEPTNHLDIDTIAWLEELLLRTSMTILFVTHDRMLLRRLATRIIELDRGHLYDWECDYDTFLRRKEEMLEAEQKEWDRFDRKLAAEEIWIRKGIRARRTRNEGRVRALKKMREERRQRRNHAGRVNLQISQADNSGHEVIIADHISFGYDQNLILNDFSLKIVRGDKIGIVGPNGCGKSTLLKLLLQKLTPDSGLVKHGTGLEIAYYDQMRTILDEEKTVRENVSPGCDTIAGTGQHIIGYLQNFLFSPDRANSKISILSGGERNRVMLARLFASPANLLVLDEPTNDLDIETLELLEELLVEFKGTVLIICHDRSFLNNVVSSTVVFAENGEVKEIVGGYDEWLAERKETIEKARQAKADLPAAPARKADSLTAKPTKLSFKEKQELQALPEIIETAEAEIAKLHDLLADPDFYRTGENSKTVQLRLSQLETELDRCLHRWEELETRQSSQEK
ncbi:MAG: ATP-binding cassette domain-containing protein [Candidatus Rifleibacteriota bacterium]